MIRRLDLRGSTVVAASMLPRAEIDVEHAQEQVRPIIEDVAARGADAVLEWGEKLDGVRAPSLRVPASVLDSALSDLDPDVRGALLEAIRRVRLVHSQQRRTDDRIDVVPGGTVTQRWVPVDRVGLYVPGGKAVYPSSVVMNVVPAQLAGVGSVAVASPPQIDNGGWPHPAVLAACRLLGVDEVYATGGAQAIALFAYGAADVAAVDLVTGPGNIWVTAAKRLLKGRIGIDAEAGPTEVMILADDSADPAHVAADLISQAEHDTVAAAVLVTASEPLAVAVESEIERQVPLTRHNERIGQALSGPQSAIVLVDDLQAGLVVVNAYGAEHLEIQTEDAREVAMQVRSAGAIFVGPHSPVSLGDYAAGSNHVLPTGGCARHSSGLGVQTFLKGMQVIEYDAAALQEISATVQTLADAENLPAHGEAIAIRFR